MKGLIIVLVLALLLPAVACSQAAGGELLMSDEPRETSPDVSQADLDLLIEGNSAFTFDLYQALKEQDGNLFYSPHSISVALAMTYAGARGETAEEMAATLEFLLEQAHLPGERLPRDATR